MPGLVAMGRRWSVGSDDVIVPAVLLFITNIFWVLLIASYGIEYAIESYAATGRKRFIVGMVIYVLILMLCMVNEVLLMIYSLKGSIMNPKPRERPVVFLVYSRLVLYVLQLVCSVIGIIFGYQFEVHMDGTKRIIACLVWELLLMVVLIYFMWDSSGDEWMAYRKNPEKEQYELFKNAYLESWNRSCKTMCCCVDLDTTSAGHFQEVARMFSELFVGEDLVATDVISALVLLDQERKLFEKKQLEDENSGVSEFCAGLPITYDTKFVDYQENNFMEEFQDMYHYMHYAWASYGYFYYLTTKCSPFAYGRWCRGLTCCCCCCNRQHQGEGERDYILLGDDCGNANTSAILNAFPPDADAELFYITYENQVGETPFFIVVDHGKKAIVVIPRGTMSFDDAVTDVMLDPIPIPLDDPLPDWHGHSGMTKAGKYMYDKIIREDLITRAQARRRGESEYSLIVTGHSLGAGTAPLLAIFLHQKYAKLKCYVFSPPGGLLSTAAIQGSRDYITSVVVGADMIPRIGLNQFQALRRNLMRVLVKTDRPKYGILCGGMFGRFAISLDDDDGPLSAGSGADMLERGGGDNRFNQLHSQLYPALNEPIADDRPELYLPGHVMHIVESASQETYLSIWVGNDSFDGLMVTPRMLMDHRGDVVLQVLRQVIQQNKQAARL